MALSVILVSCVDLGVKDFTCNCTYIPIAGLADSNATKFDESTTVKGRLLEDAQVECSFLEGKHTAQNFSGTCLIQ